MNPQPQQQCNISRTVVWFLGVNALLLSAGILVLSYVGQAPDAALFAICGTAIGSLGSLLTNTAQQQQGQGQRRATDAAPVPVTVQNSTSDPVPTQEAGEAGSGGGSSGNSNDGGEK